MSVQVEVGESLDVGESLFQYILCVGSRAIDLRNSEILERFQYILCVGSRTRGLAVATQ